MRMGGSAASPSWIGEKEAGEQRAVQLGSMHYTSSSSLV